MTLDEKNHFLRELSEGAFRDLGSDDIAYVREVEFLGKAHFSVHSADGKALTLATSRDVAMNAIQSSDLHPVTLH